MSVRFEELRHRCKIEFEEQHSWVGSYAAASANIHNTYLGDQCDICRSVFENQDQVILLPCKHGLHERCFALWDQQTCPFDGTPAEGISAISLLSQRILFPRSTRPWGDWLCDNKRALDLFLNICLQKLSTNEQFLMGLENDAELNQYKQLAEACLIPLIQDLIDAYEGSLQERQIPDRAAQRVYELLPLIPSFFKEDSYVQRLKILEEYLSSNRDTAALRVMSLVERFTRLEIDSIRFDRFVQSFHCVLFNITHHRCFQQLAAQLDDQFFSRHYQAVRELGSDAQKYRYLKKLTPLARKRLNRLAADDDPTSQLIRCDIAKIQRYNACKKEMRQIVCIVYLIVLIFLCIGFLIPPRHFPRPVMP